MKYQGFIKNSRTLDLGAIVAILGVAQANLPDLGFDPVTAGWINVGIGAAIVILRLKTTGPVGDK